jgi:hypothetical protein
MDKLEVTYRSDLITWYCYEITLAPRARMINTVTTPIHPDVSAMYDPPKYSFTYLLSPGTTWADFGTLDIIINTPYYMIDSGLEGFEKTESGYTLSLDGLPMYEQLYSQKIAGVTVPKELNFTLCENENPRYTGMTFWNWVSLIVRCIVLLPVMIVMVIGHFIYELF